MSGKFYISSYFQSNISPFFPYYQYKIFELLGYKINQVCNDYISHGDFLNDTLLNKNAEYFIFFDIDCIPLHKEAIEIILSQINDKNSIAGAAQSAVHINSGSNLYIGPFFLGLSKTVYNKLNKPDLNGDYNGDFIGINQFDVAGRLTYVAQKNNVNLKYWFPTNVEEEMWPLYQHGTFGIGTTYEDKIYHLFRSSGGENIARYIKKAKFVIESLIQCRP
jgi:GTPase SAR1 family protein